MAAEKLITLELREWEAMEARQKMLKSIVDERAIVKMTKWNNTVTGLEEISYVTVDKDELDKELQDRIIQLESREENYVKQIDEWNNQYKSDRMKIDRLERDKRMSEKTSNDYRVLRDKYHELKCELDEYKDNRVSGLRRFLPPFLRR